jgi:hypothetical protein
MNDGLEFFITIMPDTRPADYCLGCLDGSVFIDFDNDEVGRISLKRISFDGYGCCDVKGQAIPMNEADSQAFKEIIKARIPDQSRLTTIVKRTLLNNRKFIWEDALNKYGLLQGGNL